MKLPLVFTPVEFKHKNIFNVIPYHTHIIITDVIIVYKILNCKDLQVNFGNVVTQFAENYFEGTRYIYFNYMSKLGLRKELNSGTNTTPLLYFRNIVCEPQDLA